MLFAHRPFFTSVVLLLIAAMLIVAPTGVALSEVPSASVSHHVSPERSATSSDELTDVCAARCLSHCVITSAQDGLPLRTSDNTQRLFGADQTLPTWLPPVHTGPPRG